MAVAHDTATRFPANADATVVDTTSGNRTFSHAGAAGADGAVVIVLGDLATPVVSGVLYGGTAMTKVAEATDTSEGGNVQIYFLNLGGTALGGTQTVTLQGCTTDNKVAYAHTCTSTTGHTALDGIVQKNTTTAADPTANLTVVANAMVYGGLMGGAAAPSSYVPGTGEEVFSGGTGAGIGIDAGANSGHVARSTAATSAGTYTINWSFATSDDYCIAAASIKEAPAPTTTTTAKLSLASGGEPTTRTLHTIKIRAKKASGSGTVTITAALYEGANNRSGDLTTGGLTTSAADYTLTIPDASAANITSYSNLELQIHADSPTGDTIVVTIYEAYLEAPAASGAALTQTIGDSIAITDSPVSEHGWGQTIADSPAITDAETFVATYERTIADPIALTDARAFEPGLSLADSPAITDARSLQPELSLADSIAITDARSLEPQLSLADALGITDARAFEPGKSIADALGITDANTPAAEFFPSTIADAIALTDAQSFIEEFANTIADNPAITDALSEKGIGLAVADALGLTDANVSAAEYFSALADALGITDANATLAEFANAVADALGITDNVTTESASGDTTPPVTVYVSETATRVSLVAGHTTTDVTWNVDEACQAWEIRDLTGAGGATHTDGTLVASGGAVPASDDQVTTIDATSLPAGDGEHSLKIFAQDLAGNWTT